MKWYIRIMTSVLSRSTPSKRIEGEKHLNLLIILLVLRAGQTTKFKDSKSKLFYSHTQRFYLDQRNVLHIMRRHNVLVMDTFQN